MKTTTVQSYQDAMRADELAARDAEAGTNAVALDPLSGLPADDDGPSADEDGVIRDALAALDVPADENTPLGSLLAWVAVAAREAGLQATDEQIRAEAERRWTEFGDTRNRVGQVISQAAAEINERNGLRATPDEVKLAAEIVTDTLVGGPRTTSASTDVTRAANAVGKVPSSVLRVPWEAEFDEDDDFIVSPSLAERARVLIRRHRADFAHFEDLEVTYLWKRAGGKSKGKGVYGKTVKPSGLMRHFAGADFVIWLAADHCRDACYGDREIEALLFHEMLHVGMSDQDDESEEPSKPVLVPHDLEVFRREIEVYGLWDPDLKDVGTVFRQPGLFD